MQSISAIFNDLTALLYVQRFIYQNIHETCLFVQQASSFLSHKIGIAVVFYPHTRTSPWGRPKYTCNLPFLFCRLVHFSHTRSGFPLFFTHIPVPARGEHTKTNRAARRLHASHTSFREVIVMIKYGHHVASQRILDFLEAFFTFFFSLQKIHYSCEEKSVPRDHLLSSLGKHRGANRRSSGRIFLFHHYYNLTLSQDGISLELVHMPIKYKKDWEFQAVKREKCIKR